VRPLVPGGVHGLHRIATPRDQRRREGHRSADAYPGPLRGPAVDASRPPRLPLPPVADRADQPVPDPPPREESANLMLAETEAPSLGLSGPAHIVAIILVLIGAWFLLRMLRQHQLR